MKRKRKTEQMSTSELGEVRGRGRGGRVLRNRIIIHEEVVVEAREEVGRRGVGERVPKNRKRQEEVMTEAREEVGDVGGRGAGGRVLRNRMRQEEVVIEAREEVGDVEAGGRVLRMRKRLEEVVTEAREEVGQVGGGGRGRRVVRKRQEEVVIEARKEVGEAGGGGLGGRVLRKRKRDEEVVIEAREEGSHQAQPMGEEEEAQSEAWEEPDIVAPIVCRGRGRGQRQREVEVDKEEGEDDDLQSEAGEDDDLQSEAGEDDDVQAEVDAEDDDVQSEVDAEDDELQVESQEEAESQAESQEGDEESRAESQEGDEESQVESQEDDEESQVESQEDDEESDSGDDDADDGPWVGPQDRSLLKDFRNHVAASISGGTERKLLKLYNHSRLLRKWELPKTNRRFMEKVTASGLLALAEITYKYSNYVLVSSFVERWHPETNSFHFRFGEMTITLDDVPYLIGVPVEGLAVHAEVHGKEDCVALLRRTLGVTKRNAKAAVFCGGVTFEWLWNTFHELEDDATDDRVDYCVRAYLLYLLGTTLFVDKTGVRVNVSYLALLSDLRLVSTYGWGVGALGYLYRQLGQASRCHVKGMGGYITLLEAWIQEHFPMFRHAMNPNYTGDLPRAARWQSRREAKSATTVRYRVMLDDVQASQFCIGTIKATCWA